MNHHENSYLYNDVNKEIQSFLSSRENKIRETTPQQSQQSQQDILPLLESLNRTYTEINTALRTENSAALKDVILKSDVKMSLVCETLLETLRKTVEEKNNLIKENQELQSMKREHENKELNNKILIDKLKSEIEFKKASLEEMNRIIQDQKSIMNECKEESNKFRNESTFYKAKIEEIENLRSRANERMNIYEKELEALGKVIQEKDTRISTLINEKREEENKNLNIKTKVAELEAILENMNKKMEIKDKNMSLCNSELSKVLCENKKMKVEYEKYKESSGYYEGLYNSLNSQNAYLNSQLNKMLKNSEYSKDLDTFIAKYKKKLRKAKKKIKRLETEKNNLIEKVEDSTVNDTSDMLVKQIEELNDKNEKYKTRLEKLEKEKREIETKMENLNVKEGNSDFKESIKGILNRPVENMNSKEARPVENLNVKEVRPASYQIDRDTRPSDYHNIKEARTNDYLNGKETNFNRFDSYSEYNRPRFTESKNDKDYRQPIYQDSYYPEQKFTIPPRNKFNEPKSLPEYKSNAISSFEPGYINRNERQSNYVPITNHTEPNNTDKNSDHSSIRGQPSNFYSPARYREQNNTDRNLEHLPINYKSNNFYSSANFNKNSLSNYKTDQILSNHQADSTYLRLFNLENDYDHTKTPLQENLAGGFIQESSDIPPVKLELDYQQPISKAESYSGNQKIQSFSPFNNDSVKLNDFDKNTNAADNDSLESVKTYHTTSTLKEMMAKTDQLVKKFSDLENKLEKFNEGETIDNLTDKVKTYNSYYSDWNAESNESDYI